MNTSPGSRLARLIRRDRIEPPAEPTPEDLAIMRRLRAERDAPRTRLPTSGSSSEDRAGEPNGADPATA